MSCVFLLWPFIWFMLQFIWLLLLLMQTCRYSIEQTERTTNLHWYLREAFVEIQIAEHQQHNRVRVWMPNLYILNASTNVVGWDGVLNWNPWSVWLFAFRFVVVVFSFCLKIAFEKNNNIEIINRLHSINQFSPLHAVHWTIFEVKMFVYILVFHIFL